MGIKKRLAIRLIKTKINILFYINKEKAGELLFKRFCTPGKSKKTVAPPPFFDAEKLTFKQDGYSIKGYHVRGNQTKKLLILHGFSSNVHKFSEMASKLSAEGFDIYAFDAPAHGYSAGETIHALAYKQMIQKLVELYGPMDGYIAHSLGGLAICLALEEIPHTADTKLILIAPATETQTAIEQALHMLTLNKDRFEPLLQKQIYAISGKPVEWFSINRAIKNLQASVLWIHDRDDKITPLADLQALIDTAPAQIQFNITTGLGHSRIYRSPEILRIIADFMQQ